MSFDNKNGRDPVGIKDTIGISQNPATEEKQDDIISAIQAIAIPPADYPTGSGVNGQNILTSAYTSYAIPSVAPTKNHTLVLYNVSDTDMYIGYATLTTGGILLPSGATMSFDLGANQTVFAYCTSAGKVISYSYKEIN